MWLSISWFKPFYNGGTATRVRKKRETGFETVRHSPIQTDSEGHTVCPEKGRNERIAVRAVKAADSPLFFQLRTAAANSAYSKLAYGNKAVWEITLETTGIFNPPPPLDLSSSAFLYTLTVITTLSPLSFSLTIKDSRLCFLLTKPSHFIHRYFFPALVDLREITSLYLSLILGLSLSEEHSMYPLHFMRCRVQPDPPLSGCYYGDASRAKTKAEQKLSSLRQEPLADL